MRLSLGEVKLPPVRPFSKTAAFSEKKKINQRQMMYKLKETIFSTIYHAYNLFPWNRRNKCCYELLLEQGLFWGGLDKLSPL